MTSGVFAIPLQPHGSASRPLLDGQESPGFPLSHFVADSNNSLLRLIADDASVRQVLRYSPLLFTGPSGTGKTTLALHLASQYHLQNTNSKTTITTGADFARQYAIAAETNATIDFQHEYRSVHLLLIDDLQELVDKPAAQLQLVNVIDWLVERERPVLLTMRPLGSDSKPLHPGLISRVSSGLCIPLTEPGPAARREVLSRIADAHNLDFDEKTISLLVDQLSGTVTGLNNALLQLAAEREDKIDHHLARQFLDQQQAKQPSIHEITRAVARQLCIKVSDIRGTRRTQSIVQARGIAMLLSRQLTNCTLEQIGKYFSGRDHTTVLHACKTTSLLTQNDADARETVNEILAQFQSKQLVEKNEH